MVLRWGARLGWLWRRFSTLASKFGVSASIRAHAAWIRQRLFSSDRNAVAAIPLGSLGIVHLRPATSDWAVLSHVFVGEEYDSGSAPHEAALRQFYDAVCASGKTPLIVDCGANIGLTSLWYARRFPLAHIVAVEPEPANHALLKANIGQRANMTPVMAAVWDRRTQVDLAGGDTGPWSWQTRQSETGKLPTVTVPDLLAEFPDMVPMIVKIDIEGAEQELFRSNDAWVSAIPLIAFEPHDWLMPWRGTAHAVLSSLMQSPRDYLFRGETVFAFARALGVAEREP